MSGAAVRKNDGIELNVAKIFALLEFSGSPAKNYAVEVLLEQIRIFGDLSARDAFILLWNRFINATDIAGHSFSLDEFLEGVVRYVKANAKVASGKVTFDSASVVNNTMFYVQEIQKAHSEFLQSCKTSSSHPDKDFSEKILKVASLIEDNSMLSMSEEKYFTAVFTPNCETGKEKLESSEYISTFISRLRPIPYAGVDMRLKSLFRADASDILNAPSRPEGPPPSAEADKDGQDLMSPIFSQSQPVDGDGDGDGDGGGDGGGSGGGSSSRDARAGGEKSSSEDRSGSSSESHSSSSAARRDAFDMLLGGNDNNDDGNDDDNDENMFFPSDEYTFGGSQIEEAADKANALLGGTTTYASSSNCASGPQGRG